MTFPQELPQKLLQLAGVKLSHTLPTAEWAHHLLIELPGLCETVSSAPLNGGFGRYRYILNRSVDKDWRGDERNDEVKEYVRGLGLEAEHTVGLITAVSMADLTYAVAERGGWRVHTVGTAGVGNAATAGGRFPLDEPHAGTVNLIVLIEGRLSPSALVGAVQTATEAKVAAFRTAGVTTRFGEVATGTTTDTVTVVNLTGEPRSPYAGTATVPGFLVAQTVYEALTAAF